VRFCSWAGTPRSAAPASSSAHPKASPSPHSRRGETPVMTASSSANRP